MEKRKLHRITASFIVLVVMVLILMFSNSLVYCITEQDRYI